MQSSRNRTRRAGSEDEESFLNTGLESFLDLKASEAYKRPWHRLERGLRLNRIRKFIENERQRMNLSDVDTELLTNLLHRALDKKQLNSKTCVIYDAEKEDVQEIKGLVYHKTADGRIVSQIARKTVPTRRKIPGKPAPAPASTSAASQQPHEEPKADA